MARTTVETRKYDHLYDTNYAVSGAKDFYRDGQAGGGSQFVRVIVRCCGVACCPCHAT
jgi:hypothetical protein